MQRTISRICTMNGFKTKYVSPSVLTVTVNLKKFSFVFSNSNVSCFLHQLQHEPCPGLGPGVVTPATPPLSTVLPVAVCMDRKIFLTTYKIQVCEVHLLISVYLTFLSEIPTWILLPSFDLNQMGRTSSREMEDFLFDLLHTKEQILYHQVTHQNKQCTRYSCTFARAAIFELFSCSCCNVWGSKFSSSSQVL